MFDYIETVARIGAFGFSGSSTFFALDEIANAEIQSVALAEWERELLGFVPPMVSENQD